MIGVAANKRIAGMERLLNTTSGNPRWRVTFDDATSLTTWPDAAFTYDIEESWVGEHVEVTVSMGKIIGMRLVKRR